MTSSNKTTCGRAREMIQNVSIVVMDRRSPSSAPRKEYVYKKVRDNDTEIIKRYKTQCRHTYPNVQAAFVHVQS
jgi:hypothetical protein